MTTPTAPTEIKSIADALDQGIALANAGDTPPAPIVDDSDDGDANADNSGTDGSSDDSQGTGNEPDGGSGGDSADDSAAGVGESGSDDGDAGSDGTDGGTPDEVAAKAKLKADGTPKTEEELAAEAAAAKKPDHYNDPIPNALKPATKERIRFLANDAKEQRQLAEKVTQERDELIKAITDTGATPEQYAGLLDYMELVNSSDRNKLIQAANFLYRELGALSRVGGFRIPGITNLSGYPDLEKQVAEGKITQEIAEELAASRSAQAHQGKVGVAQAQAVRARQAYRAADTKAREDMNVLEAGYRKNDPLYGEKQPIIIAMLNEQIKGDRANGIPPIHPSKWPALFANIYKTLPKTLGGMRPVARPGAGQSQPGGGAPKNQPLRAQQPAGAQKREPKSVAEALDMGIEMARGG